MEAGHLRRVKRLNCSNLNAQRGSHAPAARPRPSSTPGSAVEGRPDARPAHAPREKALRAAKASCQHCRSAPTRPHESPAHAAPHGAPQHRSRTVQGHYGRRQGTSCRLRTARLHLAATRAARHSTGRTGAARRYEIRIQLRGDTTCSSERVFDSCFHWTTTISPLSLLSPFVRDDLVRRMRSLRHGGRGRRSGQRATEG